ncbi:MAG: flavin reductase [Bacteroidota bacterium]
MKQEKIFRTPDLEGLPRLYRNNLINSLSGFKSANLLGTADQQGNANLAVFNSVVHFGSNPPLLGFVTRPHVVPRHTYENIKSAKYFTINHIHTSFSRAAHQTSAKYEKQVDEFDLCGFNKYYSDLHAAPYVKESKIKIGLKFESEYLIKENATILVLGRIVEVLIDEKLIGEDGFVDLQEANTATINGLDAYLSTEKIARYSYARPNQEIEEIK